MKLLPVVLALFSLCLATRSAPVDECAQPSPEDMAKAAGVTLPRRPWHLANIWWNLDGPVENFTSLEIDVTIDRDVPTGYNLYISPCGLAKINGLQFYGGIQTNINGWATKESRERVFGGKGAIFSRWSADKKTPIGLDHVETVAADCLVESAGYEGEFASVRRPFAWTKGTYVWSVTKDRGEIVNDVASTWFVCRVKSADGTIIDVGRLRFEGRDFSYWDRHSAFVEVYATQKLPRPGIPKVTVTFGWPRINGEKVHLKKRLRRFIPTPPARLRRTARSCGPMVRPAWSRSARSSSATSQRETTRWNSRRSDGFSTIAVER